MLEAQNISWKTGSKTIVDDISLHVRQGEFLGLIGPNGCGKTSLMSILAGLRRPTKGIAKLKGMSLSRLNRRKIASQLAFVEQHADTQDHITARQSVELGRTPHLTALRPWSDEDSSIIDKSLEKVNMEALSDRQWKTLSGGEKQRLHIARAFAQEPVIMLLDEPTNHLDIQHQLSLLQLVRNEALTTVCALHDLNHAALSCDRIAILNEGRLVALDTPEKVLTVALISDVFKVDACVDYTEDGTIHIRFQCPSFASFIDPIKKIA